MHPYILSIGDFHLRYYSVMYLVSLLIALYFVPKRANHFGIDRNMSENILVYSFLISIIFARLYYVIFSWDDYKDNILEAFMVWHGGLAIHGAIIGLLVCTYFFTKRYNHKFFLYTDLALPFLLLGQAIGRYGNYANGEANGVPTFTPPSIIFGLTNRFPEFWSSILQTLNLQDTPKDISKITDIIASNGGSIVVNALNNTYSLHEYVPFGTSFPEIYNSLAYQQFGSLPLHPTFFYEMILNFIGFAILVTLWRKNESIGTGLITALYLIFYGVIRGFVTFFRADDLMYFGVIRAPHIASIIMILVGLAIIFCTLKNITKKTIYDIKS